MTNTRGDGEQDQLIEKLSKINLNELESNE